MAWRDIRPHEMHWRCVVFWWPVLLIWQMRLWHDLNILSHCMQAMPSCNKNNIVSIIINTIFSILPLMIIIITTINEFFCKKKDVGCIAVSGIQKPDANYP